jgi:hypothetical protein
MADIPSVIKLKKMPCPKPFAGIRTRRGHDPKKQPPAVIRGCFSFLFKREGQGVSPITP